MAGGRDSGAQVDIPADIASLGESGLARMDAHPDPYWTVNQGGLGLSRGRHGCVSPSECEKEGIPLRVDFVSATAGKRAAKPGAVLSEYLAEALWAKLVEQPG